MLGRANSCFNELQSVLELSPQPLVVQSLFRLVDPDPLANAAEPLIVGSDHMG